MTQCDTFCMTSLTRQNKYFSICIIVLILIYTKILTKLLNNSYIYYVFINKRTTSHLTNSHSLTKFNTVHRYKQKLFIGVFNLHYIRMS